MLINYFYTVRLVVKDHDIYASEIVTKYSINTAGKPMKKKILIKM